MRLPSIIFILILGLNFSSFCQEVDSVSIPDPIIEKEKEKTIFDFRGYLKFMQTLAWSGLDTNGLQVDNLIHNRLNFGIRFPKNMTLIAQARNRIFYGASVGSIPDYGVQVNDYDGIIPLEWILVENKSVVMSVIIDRLYFDYTHKKFQFRIGRQRINWGINTTWNPNDLFNSYNIYDFDYEERQGSDAVRIKYFPNYLSSIDVAYKFTDSFKNGVGAIMYSFNKASYDFQFLAGKFQERLALGFGWAGSIKLVGFKGEATYFQGFGMNQVSNLSASFTLDYSWPSGLYIMGTYLFNSTGSGKPINPFIEVVQVPNAENLMPAKHNVMANTSYMFNPIFSGNFGVIYSFQINSLTLFPVLTISIKSNFDLDIVGQFFFQEIPQDKFKSLGNGVFGRIKWSF